MHTKTLFVVGVMMILTTLSLLAISQRLDSKTAESGGGISLNNDEKQNVTTDTVENSFGDEVATTAAERRIIETDEDPEKLAGEEKFTGTLEEVNVGCFADGECYVVVDGRHITVMLGWTNDIVGSINGVEGFGDLEYFIGEKVSVFAGKKSDGTYTLYQNSDYNITLIGAKGVAIELGQSVEIDGLKITPKKILEDNRCPQGMMCIQSGTLVLETEVSYRSETKTVKTELGVAVEMGGATIKLLRAEPLPEVGMAASNVFYFGVWK